MFLFLFFFCLLRSPKTSQYGQQQIILGFIFPEGFVINVSKLLTLRKGK